MAAVERRLDTLSESEEVVTNVVEAPAEEARQYAIAAEVKHADGTWYRNHVALWVAR